MMKEKREEERFADFPQNNLKMRIIKREWGFIFVYNLALALLLMGNMILFPAIIILNLVIFFKKWMLLSVLFMSSCFLLSIYFFGFSNYIFGVLLFLNFIFYIRITFHINQDNFLRTQYGYPYFNELLTSQEEDLLDKKENRKYEEEPLLINNNFDYKVGMEIVQKPKEEYICFNDKKIIIDEMKKNITHVETNDSKKLPELIDLME
jgi:hypothetical protein